MKAAKKIILSLLVVLSCFALCPAQNSNGQYLFLIWDERGKYGFIDAGGRVVIKPQFDGALPFTEGLAPVSTGNNWGFIDTTGKIVVPLKYRAVSPFSDGLAAVTMKGNAAPYPCGYIDHAGQFVIKPQNKFSCPEFNEGFAVVGVYNEQWGESLDGYIDKKGELVIGGSYVRADPFNEGLALVVPDSGNDVFINREGEVAIDLKNYGGTETLSDKCEPSGSFSEGLAEVGIEVFSSSGYARYGFVNKKGKVVFELPRGMRVEGAFQNGRALILQEKTEKVKVEMGDGEIITMEVEVSVYGYVSSTGKVVIPARFRDAESFSENLAAVQIGKPKPSDERDVAGSAAEGSFAGEGEGGWACIDLAGRVVIKSCGGPLSSDELNEKFPLFGKGFGKGFVHGLFFSKTYVGDNRTGNNRKAVFGYIDKHGKYVWVAPHGSNVVPPKWWRENYASPS